MLSEKPWRAEFVLFFCAAQIFGFFVGAIVIFYLHKFGVTGFKHDEDFGNILLGTLCFQGTTWILIPIFLRAHQMDWRDAFGFRAPGLLHSLLLAAGVMVLFAAPAAWCWQEFSVSVFKALGWPVEKEAAVTLIQGAQGWGKYAYLVIFAVVIAPVAEEFIFRGVLFPFVKQLGYPRLAWIGVSALFAFVHANAPTFVSLFLLALALTWIYEKTDCLLAPIAAHALFNAANLIVLGVSLK